MVPEPLLPELFDVHCFLGRGSDAIRLADTATRKRRALDCCLGSERLADIRAALALACRTTDAKAIRALQERAGDLLWQSAQYAEALDSYLEAGRADRVSECHERLGQISEALATCPADLPDRLARLAQQCQPELLREAYVAGRLSREADDAAADSDCWQVPRLCREPDDGGWRIVRSRTVHRGVLIVHIPDICSVMTGYSFFSEPGRARDGS